MQALPQTSEKKMILAVEVVAHSIQMGQLLLTMSRGRGVPRDILPAQGTCLAASNILASLALLHIKWNWSPPPWPDLEMNAPALRVFTVRCHKPTCPHTSPSCDPTPGAHMYTNQWLQHTHINTTGSSLWPVVSWKLWFKEGKRSVKTSWWNPWASTSSSKQKKANSPIPKQQKQPALENNVLAVSLHSCLQERTLDCSSQQYKNHLPLLYLYFSRIIFIFHNQTFQVCLQVKQEGEMGKKAEN